jgi:lysozyme
MDLDKLKQDLRIAEGIRLHPYMDGKPDLDIGAILKPYGKLTAGIGRNLQDVGLSEDECYYLLGNDIKRALVPLEKLQAFLNLDEARKRVLTEMVFNMGYSGVMAFQNMWTAIRAGNFDRAADEMLNSKWAKQVGDRSERLSKAMRGNSDG